MGSTVIVPDLPIQAQWLGGEFDGDWIALPAGLDYLVLDEVESPKWFNEADPYAEIRTSRIKVPIVKHRRIDRDTGVVLGVKWVLDWSKREKFSA